MLSDRRRKKVRVGWSRSVAWIPTMPRAVIGAREDALGRVIDTTEGWV